MSYVFWFFVCSWKRGVAVRGVILKNKKAGGGLGGRAQRLPPQMHWVLLHLFMLHVLFCSSVFFLVLMGRGVAVRGISLKIKKLEGGWGEGAAPPPRCIGCCCICSCCISCFVLPFFFLILMSYVFWFFVCSWKRGVAVRGVILKNKKAGGGLGGRAQRLPPRCIGCCCICSCCISCFVLPFFSYIILMSYVFWFFACSWKRCGGERSHP